MSRLRVLAHAYAAVVARWLGPPHALEHAMNMFGLPDGSAVQNQGIVPNAMPAQSLDWLGRTLQDNVDV